MKQNDNQPDREFPFTETKILHGNDAVAAAIILAGRAIAYELKMLGNGGAATPMGALEAFGLHIGEKIETLASGVGEISDAIVGINVSLESFEECLADVSVHRNGDKKMALRTLEIGD